MLHSLDATVSLAEFSPTRVLREDLRAKTLCLLGTYPLQSDDGAVERRDAVLIIESLPPWSSIDAAAVVHELADVVVREHNDVYYYMEAEAEAESAGRCKVTMIHPATQSHIDKYSGQEYELVFESPEMYTAAILPLIATRPSSRTDWIRNILAGRAEHDRVLFRDDDPQTGFVIVEDGKWDGRSVKDLHLVVLVHDSRLRTLRDLRGGGSDGGHGELLRKIRVTTRHTAHTRYGIAPCHLRMYLHYHPTYYHLHIHATHVSSGDAQGEGCMVPTAHTLEAVEENLRLCPGYYQRVGIVWRGVVGGEVLRAARDWEQVYGEQMEQQRQSGAVIMAEDSVDVADASGELV